MSALVGRETLNQGTYLRTSSQKQIPMMSARTIWETPTPGSPQPACTAQAASPPAMMLRLACRPIRL